MTKVTENKQEKRIQPMIKRFERIDQSFRYFANSIFLYIYEWKDSLDNIKEANRKLPYYNQRRWLIEIYKESNISPKNDIHSENFITELFGVILEEFIRIQDKKSNLSRFKRDIVVEVHNFIYNFTAKPDEQVTLDDEALKVPYENLSAILKADIQKNIEKKHKGLEQIIEEFSREKEEEEFKEEEVQ